MDWKVRFVDYPSQFRGMRDSIMSTVETVLTNGDLMLRQQLRDFENHLAEFVGTRYAVGISNCTDALMLCLRASGIGPGDEVISVSHTFVATIASIHHVGATPVLLDIGDDHNMNVGLIEAAITHRTKAIVPVHLNGRVCDMTRLMAIAKRYQLIVIEDSAQALGASCDGVGGGAFGDAGCFSFYPAKLLGAYGDAGAVVTSQPELAEKIRRLRDHGRTPEGDIDGWSFNCRLDNLQAALLDLKLARLTECIRKRRELAGRYHATLSSLPQIHLPPSPVESGRYYDVYQNYEILAQERDRLVAHLRNNGIEILIPWGGKGVHQFKALGLSHFNLPATDNLFQNALMLPLHTELSFDQVDYVSATIRAFYANN
jgi:dTDP-3-amino-2,3,6-trideoxy-4-keto-D-glucose/dTDP-3-amino-3,4,6-trideoxy-alpha-D-glucose/dTDP-2,6-dideoxy-D-kanosamine transaminase